jgi:Fe-S cluster biogenesis protein NfuA
VTEEVMVRIQPTPNPLALKFVVNRTVKAEGKATFTKPSEAVGVRLAEDLFMVDGVRQLHFFENVITVTLSEDSEPSTLELEVKAVLQSRLPVHDARFLTESERRKVDRSSRSPEIQQIETILDETVRMYLQGDGGDIEVVDYADHKLFVKYQGACGTCPSSTTATLDGISSILQDRFDPKIEIIPV